MSAEIDPNEITLSYLERERELWLPHYLMAKRADGMNADANARAAFYMKHIDRLLEELVVVEGTNGQAA